MKHAKTTRGSPWLLVILMLVVFAVAVFAAVKLNATLHAPLPHPHASTVAPLHPHHPPPPVPPPHHYKHLTYTVHPGDTLWGIAGHFYHNPLKWQHLYHINAKVVGSNPNLIHIGTVLQIE